jgi:uncharacterized protein with FMN-binding domain
VRKVTKNIVGVISLGVLATSWSLGQAAESGLVTSNSAASATPETTAPQPSESTSPATSAAPKPAATGSQTSTATKSTPTPAASKTASATPAATKLSGNSQDSEVIYYRYGAIQVQVTKSNGNISDIKLLQATVRGPQYQGVPGELVSRALAANGADFQFVSGATFTSEAFQSAVRSALAKF